MKPFESDNEYEALVAKFFEDRSHKIGWSVDRPAPSIERVSCYVLDRSSVIVTEYQGCAFDVYINCTKEEFVKDSYYEKLLETLNRLDD